MIDSFTIPDQNQRNISYDGHSWIPLQFLIGTIGIYIMIDIARFHYKPNNSMFYIMDDAFYISSMFYIICAILILSIPFSTL